MEQNIYDKYKLKKVINASGKMTILGGSRLSEEIVSSIKNGAKNFYEIKDLLDKTGEYIAKLLNVESAYIVSSASSGIAQCVASCIAGKNLYDILHIQNPDNRKREIVIPKGHNVDYGTSVEVPINMGGGKIVEAGYANTCNCEHVKSVITENTAALLYIKSHHCVQKGIISVAEYVEIAHQYSLPIIVDAAAEEDLVKFYNLGADMTIYSGTKALEGPTSGLVVGKKSYIDNLKLQSKGIGRVMKVGKENIFGLTKAIELYMSREKMTVEQQQDRLKEFNSNLNSIAGVFAKCVKDSAGRAIVRSEINFDSSVLNTNALQISEQLKSGDTKIYTRDYRANENIIEIDIRDVNESELNFIYQKIVDIVRA